MGPDARTVRRGVNAPKHTARDVQDFSDEDDDYGPSLPRDLTRRTDDDETSTSRNPGATIPSLLDLQYRDEQTVEANASARKDYVDDIRHERKLDRKQQKDRLDDLLPRAEAWPAHRERQLEKKREKADANRSFVASKETSGDVDLRDADVMRR